LSLVFNFLYFSFCYPIDISDNFVGFFSNNIFSFSGFESKIDGFEFFSGQVSKKVDSFGVCLGFVGVVAVDFSFVDHEDGSSVRFFFSMGINFSVGNFELFKAVGLGLGGHHGTGDS